jgi:hypothetical protein
MASLAQRHRIRVLAEKASQAAGPTALDAVPCGLLSNIQALMMANLVNDLRRLKEIKSVERKIEVKREMLPAYKDYLDGVLAADAGGQDEVVTTVMVWHLDVLDIDRGLQLAGYVLAHDLALPERYDRDVATLLLDEVSDAVLAGRLPATEQTVTQLTTVASLTQGRDTPDQARAKLHRALGETMAEVAGDEPTGPAVDTARAALAQLNRAVELHAGIGVKKTIERLQRVIKKAEGE